MDNYFQNLDHRIRCMEEMLISIKHALCASSEPSSQQATAADDDIRFTYDGLAQYLNKDKSTIHRYKKNGALKFYQVGRTVFFKKSEVDAAMSSLPKRKGAKI